MRVSVVVVGVGAPAELVRESVDSVRAQTAEGWELCVVCGPAELASLRAAVERDGLADRIAVLAPGNVGAPAAALADGVAATRAELVTWLDAGDRLDRSAIERVVAAAADDDVDIVYTDEDQLDDAGRRSNPQWPLS